MYYRIFSFIVFFLLFFPIITQGKTIMILGDSLSSAFGVPVESGWVSLLEKRLLRQDYAFKVVNASISGETTLGAKSRLTNLLETNLPNIVIIALGGNDGLRGFALSEIERNLMRIIQAIQQYDGQVLLVPMQLPPNYGMAYNQRFSSIYERVAKKMDISLSQFILKDIAQYSELMQDDGIHPMAKAQKKMLDNIWPSLQTLINQYLIEK